MVDQVETLTPEEQLALVAGASRPGHAGAGERRVGAEQAGAGLDQLTPAEFERLRRLKQAYRDKFGFPFLFAVKGSTKHDILARLEQRAASLRATKSIGWRSSRFTGSRDSGWKIL